MNPSIQNLFEKRFADLAKFNEPLAPYLAYRVGGPADILVFPKTEEDLVWISRTAQEKNLPLTVVGTGTNLLVCDGGIRGIVLSLSQSFQEITPFYADNEKIHVKVGGGVSKPAFLEWSIQQGLTGLEFSSGVPGTIGGGIFMNAGTKYGCYGDILKELRVFDFRRGAQSLAREQLHFGYREQNAVKDSLVLWAAFELKRGNGALVRKEVERIVQERAEKQPLDFPSCGSTFKNPEGFSAGRLIEKAGLKGLRVGGAEISLKHANFILNKGNAKAADILELIRIIKERVLKEFGVPLECEVVVLGENTSLGRIVDETPEVPHSD